MNNERQLPRLRCTSDPAHKILHTASKRYVDGKCCHSACRDKSNPVCRMEALPWCNLSTVCVEHLSENSICHDSMSTVFPCALPNSQPQRCAYISLGHPAVNKGAPESNWPTKYSTSVQFDHFCQTSCFARSIVDTKRQKATISSMVSSLEFIQALAITSRSADNSFREACRRLGIAGALRRLTGP